VKIERLGLDESTVVILGSGATRGASFVDKEKSPILPPLDADFFSQAQRLKADHSDYSIPDFLESVTQIFGKNAELTMEGFLTQLEHLTVVHKNFRLKGWPRRSPYLRIREEFLQILAALLENSIGTEPHCEYHKKLTETLSSEDTVLSFNYDCVLDYNLKQSGQRIWNPIIGYGVPVYAKGSRGENTRYWACEDSDGKKIFHKKSVSLLKMHGSINWQKVDGIENFRRLTLKQRWWHQKGDLHFEIVPPEWNKNLHNIELYRRIWQKARVKLREAKVMVVVGYSLPQTDLPTQALLMVDSVRRAIDKIPYLKCLVIANPDRLSCKRIQNVLQSRISPRTQVLTFNSFKGLSEFL